MFKETYLAKLKMMKSKNPKAHFEVVTRSSGSVLSPSWTLLRFYKSRVNRMFSDQVLEFFEEYYIPSYVVELRNSVKAQKRMKELQEINKTKDVFLICFEKEYPCHRFILLEMLRDDFFGRERAEKESKKGKN